MFVDVKHAALVCLALLVAMVSCDRVEIKPGTPTAIVPSESTNEDQPEPEVAITPAERWATGNLLPWDAWYIQYMSGKRIGYYHVTVEQGSRLIQIKRTAVYELSPGGKKGQYKIELESLEHPDGTLATFSQTTLVADSTNVVEGEMLDNKLTIVTTTADQTARTALAWQPGTWGVLGTQAVLLHDPMQPGEKRKCTLFEPNRKQIVPLELSAGKREITLLPGGISGELLLPVEVFWASGDTHSRSRIWVDSSGAILKTVALDGMMINTFRATAKIGMRVADEYRLGTLLDRSIKLAGRLADAGAPSATYIVEGSQLNVFAVWSRNVRQTVKSQDALTAAVTVYRDVGDIGEMGENGHSRISPDAPTAAHSAASILIQSEHPAIKSLADELIGDVTGDAAIALALTKGLANTLDPLDFSAAVTGALVAARRLEGDCTEHALLLVALLRSRDIPARIASGLRVDPNESTLKFYMWTEAWIDDRWLSLDGMRGDLAGVDLLKMHDSAMADENPYTAILPIIDKMGLMTIKIEDASRRTPAADRSS